MLRGPREEVGRPCLEFARNGRCAFPRQDGAGAVVEVNARGLAEACSLCSDRETTRFLSRVLTPSLT